VFELQICLTGYGLEETLEQFSAITCTNYLLFLLHLIYCCHSILFSVASYLLDRSENHIYISGLYAGNFCVITEISVTYFGVFAAFPASFCLLFFAGQRHI
jgi:hypothetical protein